MKHFIAYNIFICFLSLNSYTQQIPNYTQYAYNMQILNPASVGSRADLSISILSRQQWVGVEGAPTSQTFSINGRIKGGLGIGATVVNDKIGFSETNNFNLDLSYTILTSEYRRLAFGLKGGITLFNNNLANAITPDNDKYASTSGSFPNIGFGAFYYSQTFFVGLSAPYLFETPQFYTSEASGKNMLSRNLNYFLSAGVLFELNDHLKFKPSTMVNYTSGVPISVDLNANFLYKKNIEVGVSYRHSNTISALFAVIIKEKFRIGYSYDHKFANYGENLSSHEIILHIDFDFNKRSRWLRPNSCYF
jgi:type IX secretion system PorP/SprF family membrane protein